MTADTQAEKKLPLPATTLQCWCSILQLQSMELSMKLTAGVFLLPQLSSQLLDMQQEMKLDVQ